MRPTVFSVGGAFRAVFRDRHGRLVWESVLRNGVSTQGANYLLDTAFRGQPQVTAWKVGVVSNSGYAAVDRADTANAHSGWIEFTSILGGTRPAWSPAAATGGSMVSAAAAIIQVTANGTVRGLFLASAAAVGATSGTLYCTAVASTGLAVTAGGSIAYTYGIQGQGV